jgi:hypothetical protein
MHLKRGVEKHDSGNKVKDKLYYIRTSLKRDRLTMLKEIRPNCSVKKHLFYYYIEGVVPEQRIKKMDDLPNTKLLHLFCTTNFSLCVSMQSSMSIKLFWLNYTNL